MRRWRRSWICSCAERVASRSRAYGPLGVRMPGVGERALGRRRDGAVMSRVEGVIVGVGMMDG